MFCSINSIASSILFTHKPPTNNLEANKVRYVKLDKGSIENQGINFDSLTQKIVDGHFLKDGDYFCIALREDGIFGCASRLTDIIKPLVKDKPIVLDIFEEDESMYPEKFVVHKGGMTIK